MKTARETVNILVTLDAGYIPHLNVMLYSLLNRNSHARFDVYWLHSSVDRRDAASTEKVLGARGRLFLVHANVPELADAPVSSRYPREIYYRIFAARYLPTSLDRVLYLDPDIVVNGDIRELYHLPMDRYYFAAASHTGPFITTVSSLRLDMEEDSPYINSSVMLMNLKRLRAEQDYGEVFDFIKKRKPFLILPDQDIISSLYGSRILALDTYRYNMTDRLFRQHSVFEKNLTLDWVRKNSILIHYCGRNKPWKENDSGQLGIFYQEARKQMEEQILCTG